MVQRFRFIGITALSILLLMIIGTTFSPQPLISPVSATVSFTLNISPNPALPDESVTFSGQVSPPETSADTITVIVYSSVSCGPIGDIGFIPLTVNLAPSTPTAVTFTGTANSAGVYS